MTFAGGQAASQALQFATGILIVRNWPIEYYAVWAVVLATQATLSLLADLGARDGVVALSRGAATESSSLDKLIHAALALRLRHLAWLSFPVAAYFVWLSLDGLVPVDEVAGVIALTLITAFANGWSTYYALPRLLTHDLTGFYGPQITANGVRLLLIALLFEIGHASLLNVLTVSAGTAIILGLYLRWFSPRMIHTEDNQGARSALVRYIYPLAPATVYFAFQDQVSIFVLSVMGGADSISETAALGRLAAVFQALLAANIVLAQPWIVKAKSDNLRQRVAIFLGSAAAVSTLLIAITWARPDIPLMVLGQAYMHAESEMLLAVVASAIFYVASACHCIDVGRGWIWRWTGSAYLLVMMSTQAIAVMAIGLRTASDAFLVSIVMSSAVLAFYATHLIIGLRKSVSAVTPARASNGSA